MINSPKQALYKRRYTEFYRSFVVLCDMLGCAIAKLTEKFSDYERKNMEEQACLLAEVFEKYELFETELMRFTEITEGELNKGSASPAVMTDGAKKLLLLINEIKKEVEQCCST